MNMSSWHHVDHAENPRTARSIMRVLTAVLTVGITLGACGGVTSPAQQATSFDQDSSFASSEAPSEELASGDAAAKAGAAGVSESASGPLASQAAIRREVIYTANITVEVKQATAQANALRKLVIDQGGYVLADERTETSARLVLKVAPSRFDALLKGFEKLGKVRSQSVTASDVTADMVDLEARLKSAKVSRDRLETLLRGAVKVEDVISIESELQQREALVEQMQGQLNVLKNQVGYATINLYFYEPNSGAQLDDSQPSAGQGLRNGWVALRNMFSTLILVLATILPFLAVLLPLLLLVRWALKRTAPRRAERAAKKAALRPQFVIPGPSNSEATVSGTQHPDNLPVESS
jgi:Domain of unknown function (DUF4349)